MSINKNIFYYHLIMKINYDLKYRWGYTYIILIMYNYP